MPPLPPNITKAGLLRGVSGWNNGSLSRRSGTTSGLLSTRTPQGVGTTGGGIPNPSIGVGTLREAMPRNAAGSWKPRPAPNSAGASPIYVSGPPDITQYQRFGNLGSSYVMLDFAFFGEAIFVGYEVVNGRKMMRCRTVVGDGLISFGGLDSVQGILYAATTHEGVLWVGGVELVEEGVTERPVAYRYNDGTGLFVKQVAGFPGGDPPGDGTDNGHIHAMVVYDGDLWALGHTGFGWQKGDSAAAYKWNSVDSEWETQDNTGLTSDIRAAVVFGTDLWVSGGNGTAVWNGTAWTKYLPGTTETDFDTIILQGGTTVVAASPSTNRLYGWSGTAWEDLTYLLPADIVGLRVYASGLYWAVSGTVDGVGVAYFFGGESWVKFNGLPSAQGAFVPQHWTVVGQDTWIMGGSASKLP